MIFKVMVSSTFQKQFNSIPKGQKDRIRIGLKELENDPRSPRPKCDIKQLLDTDPPKYRLRIGDQRIIYSIDKDNVKVIEIFHRGKGYP
jgi:mRNA-degrading endonuclease RelE of RelBE toxin-antitoxin system